MNHLKLLSIMLASLLLASCKAVVNAEINLSDLLAAPTKVLQSDLYLQVFTCNNHEDSRKPSDAVISAQQQIPEIFSGAQYVECFSKKMDSFAHFIIPVTLDKNPAKNLASDSQINIISNDSVFLMLGIPESIKNSIKKSSGKIGELELEVVIKINNDTEKEYSFTAFSAYIDDKPYIIHPFTAEAGKSFIVRPSNVSIDHALENGSSFILNPRG